ncbi:F0F1 ATP synthase subunit delta [Candidatus Saccharibacteria bacterium]|nr:F0F1 ATP synthase subunit delta [Candidatus Saccharibacteria bacterium]
MNKVSRRSLARWSAVQLLAGKSARSVAKHLAAAVVETDKVDDIEFLLGDIAAELEARHELVVAQVISSSMLTPQLRLALKDQVKKTTGAKAVLLQESVDRSVIGGLRVETSNCVWDHTVARKLADLKETLS